MKTMILNMKNKGNPFNKEIFKSKGKIDIRIYT